MDLIKLNSDLDIDIIDMSIVGAKGYEVQEGNMKLSKKIEHKTQRIVECTVTNVNGNIITVRYSRGSRRIPESIRKRFNIKAEYAYLDSNKIINNSSNGSYRTSEEFGVLSKVWSKFLKMSEKAYTICFGEEIKYDSWLNNLVEQYIDELEQTNKKIGYHNIALKKEYEQIQNKRLEKIKGEYTIKFKGKEAKKYDLSRLISSEPFIFDPNKDNKYYVFYKLPMNIEMELGKNFNAVYLCKSKISKKPISIALLGDKTMLNDYMMIAINNTGSMDERHYQGLEAISMKIHVAVLEHDDFTEDISKNTIEINDFSTYTMYKLKNTPKEYINIVMSLLSNYLLSSTTNYNNLFGFKEARYMIRNGYDDSSIVNHRYMKDREVEKFKKYFDN